MECDCFLCVCPKKKLKGCSNKWGEYFLDPECEKRAALAAAEFDTALDDSIQFSGVNEGSQTNNPGHQAVLDGASFPDPQANDPSFAVAWGDIAAARDGTPVATAYTGAVRKLKGASGSASRWSTLSNADPFASGFSPVSKPVSYQLSSEAALQSSQDQAQSDFATAAADETMADQEGATEELEGTAGVIDYTDPVLRNAVDQRFNCDEPYRTVPPVLETDPRCSAGAALQWHGRQPQDNPPPPSRGL